MKSAFVLLLYVSSITGQGTGSLTSVPFDTLAVAVCQAAGEKAAAAFADVDRRVHFVCVEAGAKADAHH